MEGQIGNISANHQTYMNIKTNMGRDTDMDMDATIQNHSVTIEQLQKL
jgi:hypothetical protein